MSYLTTDPSFAERILAWFLRYGRQNLPWQQLHKSTPDPYQVWVSEIMLQQTQVASVIDYYQRFMKKFPSLEALADADSEEVLAQWAGLGYYARARNLHKSAKILKQIHQETGTYPQTLAQWEALSGIGKSTAGAIMAMGLLKFGVICDGNVKRVLTRHFAIDDDITKSSTDKKLWALAEALTPHQDSGRYAQAMMDMGATLCTKNRPHCELCPINNTCKAYQTGTQSIYPVKSKKSTKPTHHSFALHLSYNDKILWLRREVAGIWGGLWCLPLMSDTLASSLNESIIIDTLGLSTDSLGSNLPIRHTLTHFHWLLSNTFIDLTYEQYTKLSQRLSDANAVFGWYNNQNTLPKPVAMDKLLEQL